MRTFEERPPAANELLIIEKGRLMNLNLEEKIKDFVRSLGVDLVGLAGPDRLDGPPSLDPTYTLKGARSIVSLVLPMDQGAIYGSQCFHLISYPRGLLSRFFDNLTPIWQFS